MPAAPLSISPHLDGDAYRKTDAPIVSVGTRAVNVDLTRSTEFSCNL
ncbi:hypothetical protein [Gordonia soli]|nr:hypothetical protein [Gordonia soli]